MAVRLFDDIARHDASPALQAEPKYEYLNRSARRTFHAIREVLEDWFSHYPEPHRGDFRGRFRSRDNSNHQSAFFELFLHELLLKLGHNVEVHPPIRGTTKRPDFLATSNNGQSFYLEVAVVSGESRDEAASAAIKNTIHDALNKLDSPNFFISWEAIKSAITVPSARKIRAFLEEKLGSLDPDAVGAAIKNGGFDSSPHWTWSDGGWAIEFSVVPKSPQLRGKPGVRPVGMGFEGGGWVDNRTPLRDAILEKARKYGEVDLPYVVAINSLAMHLDKIDILEALFGKEQFVYTQTPEGIVGPEAQRAPDGVWTNPAGHYTRLTAVLLIHALFPWNIPRCSPCVYHNPFARLKLPCELDRLPRMKARSNQPAWETGEMVSSIFGLPEDWPGTD